MKLNRIKLSVLVLGYSLATALAQTNSLNLPAIVGGPFRPEWNSLPDYQSAPKWFRDAKFVLWTHLGPQCQPEHGDWYARSMYQEGGGDYMSPIKEYGHPSTNGFKDMIHAWTRYEVAEGADKTGSLADVPYDRKLTKADGKGQWWDGLDLQALYVQNHARGNQGGWGWWDWNPAMGATVPDAAYETGLQVMLPEKIQRPDPVRGENSVVKRLS